MTSARLRITCVISSLRAGGSERVLAWLATALAARGHAVSLITAAPAAETPVHQPGAGVTVRNLGTAAASRGSLDALSHNLRHLLALRRAVRAARPDVVLAFGDRTNVRVLLALADTGIPVVVSERTNPRLFPTGRVWSLLRRFVYPRAAAVVAPNARCLETLAAVAPARRRVVPNPVLAPPVAPVPPSAAAQDRPVIVALGRLVDLKGFDMLIRAFAAIADETPGWSLEIHGEGPERAALETLARTLGVGERVRLPGFARDPYAVLAGAGIFALSSRLEGSPNALADAMASGVAVVAFDCEAGPRELIRHGEDGLLVPAGDVVALAEALRDLAYDSGLRKRLGDKAREIARRFDPDDVATQWESLLTEVAGASGRTSSAGVSL